MQKKDEVAQVHLRNRLSLSLMKNGAKSGSASHLKRLSNELLEDTETDTKYPVKRKHDTNTLPKNTKKPKIGSNMLNGYRSTDVHHRTTDDSAHSDGLPVATLSNMGNTCYLNSVLYTLRFAPSFLHNLHHLVADLALMHSKLNQTKAKSSSLGRNIGSITGPSSRSSSSKDLLSLGNSQNDTHPKSKMQIATEKLHELYMSLHSLEMKDNNDPYQPASFLQALIDVNSIYQGHQQQDAHELLVHLLDILRETCDLLAKQAENQPDLQTELLLENAHTTTVNVTTTNSSKSWGVRRSWKKHKDTATKKIDKVPKDKQIREEVQVNGSTASECEENCTTDNQSAIEKLAKKIGFNFVSEDFGGITLRRTKCLECESVTERKEPFYDICVPIPVSDSDIEDMASQFYRHSCVTTENLRDTNKYWCEQCVRYNEARREVSYERLPNLLVLQLKRFSTSVGGTEKMNNYVPTPLVLECFCDQCSNLAHEQKLHSYQLYAVIMHLGATMASGHYIAYTRASDHHHEYTDCCRDHSKLVNFSTATTEKSINFLKFLKPKSLSNNSDSIKSGLNHVTNKGGVSNGIGGCRSMDCCGIKLSKSVIENAINSSNRDGNKTSSSSSSRSSTDGDDGHLWLECDDDVVRTLSTKDFQKLLSSKRSKPATPYLLFYSKIKDNIQKTNVYD